MALCLHACTKFQTNYAEWQRNPMWNAINERENQLRPEPNYNQWKNARKWMVIRDGTGNEVVIGRRTRKRIRNSQR